MAKSDDLSPLRKEFGLLLRQARDDLTQSSVAPQSKTVKPAIGTLSNWENGRHLPASQQELQDHLNRIDRKARLSRARSESSG